MLSIKIAREMGLFCQVKTSIVKATPMDLPHAFMLLQFTVGYFFLNKCISYYLKPFLLLLTTKHFVESLTNI